MAGKLLKEIHRSRPFDSVQQEVFLNVIRTADFFMRTFEDLLKPYNLSATQYNVLRILRGHGDGMPAGERPVKGELRSEGVPCKTIGEQMITRDPDITRLLDRLEARSLIVRQRDTRDRRVVCTQITLEGLRILKELDAPVIEFHRQALAHMSEGKLAQLTDLLETVRGG